jgi:hypothetical protein
VSFLLCLGDDIMFNEKWYHSRWVIGILFALWFLIVPVIIAIYLIIQRQKEWKATKQKLKDDGFFNYDDLKEKMTSTSKEYEILLNDKEKLINDKETILEELLKYEPFVEIQEVKNKITNEIDSLHATKDEITNNITLLKTELIDLKNASELQSFGFYDPKYGFENSELYQQNLDEIRKNQKNLVSKKEATNHSLEWTIGSDKKKGREFILDTIKLTLRAFNNECDNIISKVRYNNIDASEKRINKVFEDLNKLTDMQYVSIKHEYLNLKLEELYLKYEFEQKVQEEKEEQLEIKERMREEAKAIKELEKAKEKVEKEEKHFELAIDKLKQQIEESTEKDLQKLLVKLKELEGQLEETKKNKEDVLYRVQNTRAGYVYIISNIGSFGENVYKIGMTRRLEPLDRVRELGDASVPFTFDVHAMIFSDDAPGLENAIHKALAHNKVNKINDRKEFFRIDLHEVEILVKQNHNKTVQFTKLAEAVEYRKSLQLEKKLLTTAS